jgi:hypothetical protein
MNRSVLAAVGVLALVAAIATPASAQQVAVYTNPLDQQSDVSNWSYIEGYPWYPTTGNNVAGYTGNCMSHNDGSGNLDWWFYGYGESDLISLQGLQDPIFSFWCRHDLGQPDYRDHYIQFYDAQWNYGQFMTLGPQGYGYTLDCDTSGDWHQHLIPIDQQIISSGAMRWYWWAYFEYYSFYPSGYDGWAFDHFQVLVPDITAPDLITNLAATNPTLTEIALSWTSPADDDTSGVAASFDLRMSTTPITNVNFSSATQLTGEPAPDVAGTQHNVLVPGLTHSTTYYFAIQTTDHAGNVSLISNVPSVSTLSPPPPPPPPGGPLVIVEEEVEEDILPCAAGSSAAPTGLLALAGLILLAAVAGMVRR